MLERHSSAQQSSGSGSREFSQQQPGSARSGGGSPDAALDKSTYQALPPGKAIFLGAMAHMSSLGMVSILVAYQQQHRPHC